jgi:hypothetical protein
MPTSCERLEATIGIAPVLIKGERGNNGFRFSAQSDFPRLEQISQRFYETITDTVSSTVRSSAMSKPLRLEVGYRGKVIAWV